MNFPYGAAVVVMGDTHVNGNGPAIGHGGDRLGYHSTAYYFPKAKATIVVMHSDKGPTGGFPLGATWSSQMFMSVVNPYFGTTPQPMAMMPSVDMMELAASASLQR